jgi:hypothetical protein
MILLRASAGQTPIRPPLPPETMRPAVGSFGSRVHYLQSSRARNSVGEVKPAQAVTA